MMPEDPYAYVVAAFQAPPSPDYVHGLEEPEQAPLSPEFVPEPVYPEFMPPEDDVLPIVEQLLPVAILPNADLPGYVLEFDPEEDPEEDDDEDHEEDLVDYPTNRDDKEEEEPSGDEADDEDDDKDDEEEEEEHPALADSVLPPPVHRTIARISIPAQAPVPFLSKEEVDIFLAIPTPPPSPLTPLSSPLPHIPSPPLPVSPSLPISSPPPPASPTYPLGFRAVMIRLRAEAGRPEVCLPPRKRLCIALGPRYEVGESSSAPTARPTRGFRADYGFVATLDDEIRRDPERDFGYGITNTWDEMLFGMPGAPDTDKIYGRLDEAHDARAVLNGRLNLLQRDRRSHAYIALLMEREARLSLLAQQVEIGALQAVDRTRHAQLAETLTLLRTHYVKMAPKRATRSTPATTTTTTSITNAQLKALIDQGVADALAVCDAGRSINGDDSHNSGTGVRRQAPPARECTYPDFMKFKPLYFKGIEGVIELT
ncbi:hypothetical protein Tco_1255569 [Tanacetum coccineum]